MHYLQEVTPIHVLKQKSNLEKEFEYFHETHSKRVTHRQDHHPLHNPYLVDEIRDHHRCRHLLLLSFGRISAVHLVDHGSEGYSVFVMKQEILSIMIRTDLRGEVPPRDRLFNENLHNR